MTRDFLCLKPRPMTRNFLYPAIRFFRGIINKLVSPVTRDSLWIGLSDLQKEGDWKYVDGVPATITNTNFASGEPNNGGTGGKNADCGQLWDQIKYQMDDDVCEVVKAAICERR